MKYLKVWTDFEEVLSPLNDDEIGRLFLSMLRYARTGEEPEEFPGNESFLWAVAKRDIDTMAEKSETLRQNGLKGGRPKATETKQNQTEATESKINQSEPNKSLKEKKRNEIKRNENEFIDDGFAREIVSEQDRVLNAAETAGFPRTDAIRAKLIDLYSLHGLQKMLDGINACVDYGVTTIAYLTAVLKGEPKKKPGKTVTAQKYEQRDYDEEQEAAFRRMLGTG